MKNFNLSQFLGCCVISIGIIVAGWLISKELPDSTSVPSCFSVATQTEEEYGKFLSIHEVGAYLGVVDADIDMLLKAGELEGTYTLAGENYVFSREKLDEWVEKRIR